MRRRASEPRFVEPVAKFLDQRGSRVENQALIVFADMIFEPLFAGQDQPRAPVRHRRSARGHFCRSIRRRYFARSADRARAGAIVIVIVLAGAVVAEQHREKPQRRNIVTGYFQARSQRGRQQQARKPPQPSPEHRGKQQTERRQADSAADQKRLDQIAHDLIER